MAFSNLAADVFPILSVHLTGLGLEAFEKHGFELLLSLSFPIVSDEDAKVFADGSEASLGDLASMNSLSDSGNEMVTVVMGLTSKAHFIEGLKYSQYLRNYLKLSAPR